MQKIVVDWISSDCKSGLRSWQNRRLQLMGLCGLLMLIAVGLAACFKPVNRRAIADVDYWTCAMHPSVHSDAAGKCPICGMDLIPVTKKAGAKVDHSEPAGFNVPVQRQQQIGVTYTEARKRPMWIEIRSVGTLEVDQSQVFVCVTGVDGYVEELRVNSPGERVTAGDPLIVIHSPDLRSPEQELIKVVNLSRLWLWANFYENEIGLLREGEPITVTVSAVPDRTFDGKISAINPTIDPIKRTRPGESAFCSGIESVYWDRDRFDIV